jgi:protein-L-isoaspartate(D-aspartate) O-methyltransferase
MLRAVVFGAWLVGIGSCGAQPVPEPGPDFQTLRRTMVEQQLASRDISDRRVLETMAQVPRHLFVPDTLQAAAYEDRPQLIGEGQTISQPYIVALMTQLVRPKPGDRVLEVGTGSGYQAAVLSSLCREVYTIEIVEPLAAEAAARLSRLGYDNIRTRTGNGYLGWPEAAPFDGILVTAGATEIPPALIEQLKPGGRMIIPVGEILALQVLKIVEKDSSGGIQVRDHIPVRFVPLRRE